MSQPLRVLVVSNFSDSWPNHVRDFLFAFHAHSAHRVSYVHDPRTLGRSFEFREFDVIALFWTVDLLGPDLSAGVKAAIKAAPALKVVLRQFESRNVAAVQDALAALGAQIVLSAVPERDHELYYSKKTIPSLQAVYTIRTAYAADSLDEGVPDVTSKRPVDIGYRTTAPYWALGSLGQERLEIAQRFRQIATRTALKSDISTLDRDSLEGRAWSQFLKRCRCLLATESGTSLVDFDGDIALRADAFLSAKPGATFAELRGAIFASADQKVIQGGLPPHAFEAAAAGTLLICHEGDHGGVLKPDVHYLPVKKDYSNTDEVVAKLHDDAYRQRVCMAAYEDLIRSRRFSFAAFVEWFDGIIVARLPAPVHTGWTFPLTFHAHRWLTQGQNLFPWNEGFVKVPRIEIHSTADLAYAVASFSFQLLTLVIGALKALLEPMFEGEPAQPASLSALKDQVPASSRPVLSRFLEDPFVYVWKVVAFASVILTERDLRRLLVSIWSRSSRGQRPGVAQLSEDMVKLALVLRLRRQGRGEVPVDVNSRLDGDTLRFEVDARESAGRAPTPPPVASDLRAAFAAGSVTAIVWDHSRLGTHAEFPLTSQKQIRFFVGEQGLHRFPTLVSIAPLCPDELCHAVEPLLH